MDKTIERRAIYKTFTGNPGSCPQCGGKVQKSYQSYMVATRANGKMADSFMSANSRCELWDQDIPTNRLFLLQ
jgi:hypothetical protein